MCACVCLYVCHRHIYEGQRTTYVSLLSLTMCVLDTEPWSLGLALNAFTSWASHCPSDVYDLYVYDVCDMYVYLRPSNYLTEKRNEPWSDWTKNIQMAHDYKDISSICNFKNANKTLRFDNTMQAKQECPCHELWSIETSLLTLGSDTRREYTHAPILAIPFLGRSQQESVSAFRRTGRIFTAARVIITVGWVCENVIFVW